MRAEVCFACAAILVQMRSSDRVHGSLQFFASGFYNFIPVGSNFYKFGRPLDAFLISFGRLLDAFWMPLDPGTSLGSILANL